MRPPLIEVKASEVAEIRAVVALFSDALSDARDRVAAPVAG